MKKIAADQILEKAVHLQQFGMDEVVLQYAGQCSTVDSSFFWQIQAPNFVWNVLKFFAHKSNDAEIEHVHRPNSAHEQVQEPAVEW